MKFYLAREGVAFGPYTEFQVRESVRLGIFEQGDLALAEDGKEWSTVAQLLPVAGEEKIVVESPKPVPVPADRPVVETAPPMSGVHWPAWRLAWAVPVALVLCTVGTWVGLRQRAGTAQPAPKQVAVAKAPAAGVQPEPAARPPTDDMTLPSRENLSNAPLQASTVANSQVPPAESAPNLVPPEESTKTPEVQRVIEGQINISARNGRSYEPPEVEVRLYPAALLKPHLEKRGLEANAKYDELGEKLKAAEAEKENQRKISDAAFNAYVALERNAPNRQELEAASADAKKAREKAANDCYNLRHEREAILSGAFYLEDLPPAANVTRTDAQGKFRLTAPDEGEFAVVAGTQRDNDGVERYYWFVPVNLIGESSKTVLLSNNNTTAHGSAESLVQTVD